MILKLRAMIQRKSMNQHQNLIVMKKQANILKTVTGDTVQREKAIQKRKDMIQVVQVMKSMIKKNRLQDQERN
nr:unnamed protein product [Callosobruchus analis]